MRSRRVFQYAELLHVAAGKELQSSGARWRVRQSAASDGVVTCCTYLRERIKPRTNGVYPARNANRVMKDCVMGVNFI